VLTQINIQHFKCFENLELPLAQLTLLTGTNASGKSSVLQGLVLLHQTMREHEWSRRLMLNGETIKLGTVLDVVDQVHGRNTFQIGLKDNETNHHWTFEGERSEMSLLVKRFALNKADHQVPQELRYLLPLQLRIQTNNLAKRLRGLSYITAERVGPREVYDLADKQSATVVGAAGEYAMSVLHWGREEPVIEGLTLPNVASKRFQQVEARMATFFPGFAMELQQVARANAVSLGLRTYADTDFLRPVHMGFGLTQVLPIVVAALSAGKDDILLIENPEVHLHPAGQALMGQFLADVARAGVQVIVETHSDHVLSGIRRSVKAAKLEPEQVALHFFRPRNMDSAQVVSPQLDRFGNVDAWPEGFFDQFDKDANYFAGWGE
jgi:predicted ATPase